MQSQYKPLYQLVCIGLKEATAKSKYLNACIPVKHSIYGFNRPDIFTKVLCSRQRAEEYIQELKKIDDNPTVYYSIIEQPRNSPFEVCHECPSRKRTAPNYY